MVSFGITSILAKINTLNNCIEPVTVKNCDLHVQSWEGVNATLYTLMFDSMRTAVCAR
jgi:hypothetical protein